MDRKKHIIIVGGGPAGLEAAEFLFNLGYGVTIIEKESAIGGKLTGWHKLFPDRRPAEEVMSYLTHKLSEEIIILTNSEIQNVSRENTKFIVHLKDGMTISSDVILLTTGFDVFNASLKEEYGYGIYDNVITSVDLEKMFVNDHSIITRQGRRPKKIAFVHCVGSRDEKAGNLYCSSVCCVTGVKQAIELKEFLPDCEIIMFYMDIRMYGRFYEDLYLEAQEKHHVQFIRGRLSEAAETVDGNLVLKADDTLSGNPIKVNVDMLILLIGFVPSACNTQLSKMLDISCEKDGFFSPMDMHYDRNSCNIPGIYMAGACTGPKNIEVTLADARSVALKIHTYLKTLNHSKTSKELA